jgi:HEAT repeat protein
MAGSKWAETLHHPDRKLRRKAAFTLGNIGPSDPVALPALLEALGDKDAGVRCEVILALLKCGRESEETIPAITKLEQQDADLKVRRYALQALQSLRREGRER